MYKRAAGGKGSGGGVVRVGPGGHKGAVGSVEGAVFFRAVRGAVEVGQQLLEVFLCEFGAGCMRDRYAVAGEAGDSEGDDAGVRRGGLFGGDVVFAAQECIPKSGEPLLQAAPVWRLDWWLWRWWWRHELGIT